MLVPLSVSIAVDAAFIEHIRPRDKELFLLFTILFMQKCAIFQPYFRAKYAIIWIAEYHRAEKSRHTHCVVWLTLTQFFIQIPI